MKRYLTIASFIAINNDNHYKHGAVLVKSGRVIATAPNIFKNSPTLFLREHPNDVKQQKISIRDNCSTHAEAKVVKLAGSNAQGSIVYIARVNRRGERMLSKPCRDCHRTLVEAGVKAVVYTSGK